MKKFSNISTTLSDELKNLVVNKDFLKHLETSEYDLKDIEEIRTHFINGRCDSVCRWMSGRFDDVEFYLLYDGSDDYHIFMKQNGLFYDGYNYDGVSNPNQLQFVQDHMKGKYNDDEIMQHLYYISTGEYDRDKIKEILHQ